MRQLPLDAQARLNGIWSGNVFRYAIGVLREPESRQRLYRWHAREHAEYKRIDYRELLLVNAVESS